MKFKFEFFYVLNFQNHIFFKLRQYESNGNKFELPIKLGGDGHTPYVDPAPPPTLTQKLGAAASNATQALKHKLHGRDNSL